MHEKQVLLVRHPETEANVTGRWVGRGNAPFTDHGKAQIPLIVAQIVGFAPEAIWSSPLGRARVPAELAAAALEMGHTVDDRLSELDFGQAEGLTFAEAVERGIAFDFKAEDTPVADGGESRGQIRERTGEVLREALEASDRIAVVTHGGVFRSALVYLLGLPPRGIWAFHIRNAQVGLVTVGEWGSQSQWAHLEEFHQA